MRPRAGIRRGVVILATCLPLAAACRSRPRETLEFPALADTYARSDRANTNFGTSSALYTDGSPATIIYLRFTVSGTAGRPVEQARLRLQVTERSTGSGGTVHVITDDAWSETTLTWNTRRAGVRPRRRHAADRRLGEQRRQQPDDHQAGRRPDDRDRGRSLDAGDEALLACDPPVSR
jgi:hypothetical protein